MFEMDWILYRGGTIQTYLPEVLAPIMEDISDFKWLMSDLDYIADSADVPVNFDQEYFILNKHEFRHLLSHRIQFIWGTILGFHSDTEISFNSEALPYVDNSCIWTPGNIQIPGAAIEIDCFDSSVTIVKFSDKSLSKKFYDSQPEFIPLTKFKG